MSVLSLSAISRIAVRYCRDLPEPTPRGDVITYLTARGIDPDQSRAGIRLAVITGRLVHTLDREGRPCVSLPDEVPEWVKRSLEAKAQRGR